MIEKTKKLAAICGGAAVLFLFLAFCVAFALQLKVFGEEYDKFRSVKRGMGEQQVIKLLGQPYKVFEAGAEPEEYCEPGYSCSRRTITSKVYVYIGSEPIAYVYFDRENKVEEAFVGGS